MNFYNIISFVNTFFKEGHSRSVLAKKNIAYSFLIKMISILVNLTLVPLTINYLNPTRYGIWLTLSSIIAWFSFFDIGFGHGLRNKLVEARALGDYRKAKTYISTTYCILTIIFLSIWLLFYVLNIFLDWNKILNVSLIFDEELSKVALIVISFFCLQMILRTINTVIIADQKPAKASFFDMIGQVFSLLIVYILTISTKGSLIYLSIGLGGAQIFMLMVSSLFFYSRQYKFISPSFNYINFSLAKEIINLGFKFFIIQIGVIVIFQSNNVIITQVGSPEDVTIFNIAYKYLGVALTLFSIILSPFWSAITDAYVKEEINWILNLFNKFKIFKFLLFLFICLMVAFSNFVYLKWVGERISVPIIISCFVGIYVYLMCLVVFNTQFINGFGKVKILMLSYLLAIIFHVPLAFYLGSFFGLIGVISSSSFFYIIIYLLTSIQIKKLLSFNAAGIWNS